MSKCLIQPQTRRRIAVSVCMILMVIILAGLNAGFMSNGEAAILATATRTPTVTPTLTPITGALKKQLVFSGLGGGGPGEVPCEKKMLKSQRLPALVELGRLEIFGSLAGDLQNLGGVCIFGIPFQSGFTVDLYRPDGALVNHLSYQPTGSYDDQGVTIWGMQPTGTAHDYPSQLAAYDGNVPMIYLELWWPAGLAEGRWRINVTSRESGFAGEFTVPPFPQIPVVRLGQPPVWRFSNADPLGNPKERYFSYVSLDKPLNAGDNLQVYGANFTPGSTPLIGVYRDQIEDGTETGNFDLETPLYIRANQHGEWTINYVIPPTDPAGDYILEIVLHPDNGSAENAGDMIYYHVGSWQPCPNTYTSRLSPGMRAKVIEGQKANRLRAQPTTSNNNIIGSIPAGQPFLILDGPRCAEGWVWWNVRTQKGQTGWTSEGEQNERWLEPTR